MSQDKKIIPFRQLSSELKPGLIREHPSEAEKIYNALLPREQLKLALSWRGKDRMELLLLSHQAKALVRSLPAQELYLTIKEVGEQDALPLLKFASQQQLTYIFDLEFWEKDLFCRERIVKWLDLLWQADEAQFQSWLKRADPELLIGILQKLIQVFVADPDNLGAEPWRDDEDIFTLDGQYYFKPLDKKDRKILERTLIYLRDLDAEQFYGILDQVRFLLPSEIEDIAYRVRSGRLEDYGFYPFEEAFEIYRYLSPEQLKQLESQPEKPLPPKSVGVRYPIMLAEELPGLLNSCLTQLTDWELEDFYHQCATLANKVMIADFLDLTKLENVRLALEKVYGYLEIGLSVWSEGRLERAVEILKSQWLQYIFQAGFSEVLKLRFRAQRIVAQEWLKNLGKPYHLFGEVDGKRIQALIEGRPKFYSEEKIFQTREFRSFAELRLAEKSVARAEFYGKLFFEVLGLEEARLKSLISIYPFELNFQVILATLLVSGVVKEKPEFEPVEITELKRFIQNAMAPKHPPRKIIPGLKNEFMKWLEGEMLEKGIEPTEELKELVESAINALEQELGGVREVKKIEREMVSSVVIAKEKLRREKNLSKGEKNEK